MEHRGFEFGTSLLESGNMNLTHIFSPLTEKGYSRIRIKLYLVGRKSADSVIRGGIVLMSIIFIIFTGCFLRPDIERLCLTFTIGPDRIWFCLIPVPDFFYNNS